MKYYVTFGQQYRKEPHPKVKYADPDGYVLINAENYNEARQKAFKHLGVHWAFIYSEEEFKKSKHWFPLGVLHEIE